MSERRKRESKKKKKGGKKSHKDGRLSLYALGKRGLMEIIQLLADGILSGGPSMSLDERAKLTSKIDPSRLKKFKTFAQSELARAYGTQEPVIRCYTGGTQIQWVSAGSTFTEFVRPLKFSDCIDSLSWAVIFDEFQYVDGKVEVIGGTLPGKLNPARIAWFEGYVDYADATNPTSLNNILSSDTHKRFFPEGYEPRAVEWEIKPQQQPDTIWQSTASTVAYMWWKWYFPTGSTTGITLVNSDTVFTVLTEFRVRFRQVTGD